jgi:glutamate--cysteine ligase
MLSFTVEQQLARLCDQGDPGLLQRGKVGLEKESLRVAKSGGLAQTPHPAGLGSSLTHPWITTDYSEALLELVTPPCSDHDQALDFLRDLHTCVYRQLDDEILWSTSMPCVLAGGKNIPVARYGSSNAGQMKTIYRLGLGYRYGRVMQVIAGVHYNFSFADEFWPMYQQLLGEPGDQRKFRDARYMGLVRNLQRYGWLIPYLFGASPAVCKSFFLGKKPGLEVFDETTFYEPWATSLRMGDIGYQNRREEGMGIKANYDTLGDYVASLSRASRTSALLWEELGVKVQGEYRQLNTNILQIENEYYSSVRPKQIIQGMEPPSMALTRDGIAYVELRSLDVNAYQPLGVDRRQLCFIQTFMSWCMLHTSPCIILAERREIDHNILKVAHEGRRPGLELVRDGKSVALSEWGGELLESMRPVAEVLDDQAGHGEFQLALDEQIEKMRDPERTPSGMMLAEMRENGEGFYQFARRRSQMQLNYFSKQKLPDVTQQQLDELALESVAKQKLIEESDTMDLDSYLAAYFAQ